MMSKVNPHTEGIKELDSLPFDTHYHNTGVCFCFKSGQEVMYAMLVAATGVCKVGGHHKLSLFTMSREMS